MLHPGRLLPIAILALAAAAAAGPSPVAAADDPAVVKAIQFLRTRAGSVQTGEAAMVALALLKADVPGGDPALTACMAKIQGRFTGSVYTPERTGGSDIYEAAVVCMALVNRDPKAHRSEIEAAAQYLIGQQKANGSWDYTSRTAGDTSISQYAVLGLWEAENAGVKVPPSVWDRAAAWYMSVQSTAGSWNYHRDEVQYPETGSMTAAGVGSLLICQRQLTPYRRAASKAHPLLIPLIAEGQQPQFEPQTSAPAVEAAIRRGWTWLARNYQPGGAIFGRSSYYGLYGIERIGALADKETLGGLNWYELGRRYIASTQRGDGSWSAEFGVEPNTAYGVLFLTKATAKSIRKFEINRLGAGTLLGGRGLPQDLSSLTVAQGRVVVRPMNGAVEGMLAVLEDPRAEGADSALAGLVSRYQGEGPEVLRPHKDRFRKLLADPDPGIRRVAAWGLGRIGDMDVVPALIATLRHPLEEDSVVAEARTSLEFLGRKIDGFGPEIPSTPEQRDRAAQAWRAWYDATRPIAQEGPAEVPRATGPTRANR